MNVWTQDIMQKTWYWKEKKSNTHSHLLKQFIDKASRKFENFRKP